MKRHDLENIENFNKITAALFATLYESFPQPIMIFSCSELCNTINIDNCQDIAKNSVEFLQSEGFLTYTSISGNCFSKMRLTLKGLSTLQKLPSTLQEPKQSLGASIVKNVKDSAWGVATGLTLQALGG